MFGSKPIWKSKTFWFNVLGGIATFLLHAGAVLPPEWAAAALAIGNLLLRYVTKTPVTLT